MNNAIKALLRTHYLELDGYVSAGMENVKTADKTFLNANENPYELPGMERFNRYPEPQPAALRAAYARTYGVDENHIIMTRGADEAIVILTKLFCEPHEDAVLINPPTFGMYGVDAKAMPGEVVEIPLIKEAGTFKLDTDAIIKACYNPQRRVKMVYVCSPNNPTGNSFDHAEISKLCEELEGQSIVILDETYAEFSAQGSMTDKLAAHPNLIILRTLSKSYSMAGMRMGCFLCADEDFINLVKAKALDAYPLPHASVDAAIHVMSPEILPMAKANIDRLIEERLRVEVALQASDKITHVYQSDANFLLVEMENAAQFIKFCADNNVILRDFSSKPLTENCIRISIGTPEQNDLVLKLLEEF